MLRLIQSSPALRQAARTATRRTKATAASSSSSSSSNSAIAGDSGKKATHLHHHMTTLLALATPLYLIAPPSYSDGLADKSFGILFAATLSAHSWIGLNYVATDYVPKISRGLVGPARVFNVALGAVTFLGLGRIALNGRGGIKGCLGGLWRPETENGGIAKEEEEEKDAQ